MEIEAEVLLVVLVKTSLQDVCEDSRVSHLPKQLEDRAGSSSAWR